MEKADDTPVSCRNNKMSEKLQAFDTEVVKLHFYHPSPQPLSKLKSSWLNKTMAAQYCTEKLDLHWSKAATKRTFSYFSTASSDKLEGLHACSWFSTKLKAVSRFTFLITEVWQLHITAYYDTEGIR